MKEVKKIRKQKSFKTPNKILISFVLLSLTILFSVSTVFADPGVIYVNNQTGNDTWDGQSDTWNGTSGPKLSIRSATEAVTSGGTVNIADGIYNGANNRGITIDKDMTITGQSQTSTIINGEKANRIFYINSGVTAFIQNLTINGTITQEAGAAIINYGNVTVTNSTFTNNTAIWGGAIYNYSTVTVADSTFTNNTVNNYGGVIHNDHGTVTVTNSTFNNNTAKYGGGAIMNYYGTLTVTGSTFTNNTSNNDGGAIYNEGTGYVNFNRIVGNTAANGDAIYNYSGNLDATNNWWGSNTNPKDITNLIAGNVDGVHADPWIVLTIAADPTTINNLDTSQVTADLNHNSDNTDISGQGLPEGIPVTFTATNGTMNPASSSTVNGAAVSTFTANKSGTATVNATVDLQTVSVDININKAPTQLSVSDTAGVNNETINLTATLSATNNNPVIGKEITFQVNGSTVGTANTDANGIATLTYTITQTPGTYNIGVVFAEDDDYLGTTGSGTLTVDKKVTTLVVSDVSGVNGQNVNLQATLTDSGTALPGKPIQFAVNGITIGTANTDANGIATLTYTITQTPGTYNIGVVFAEDDDYLGTTGSGTLTVDKKVTTLVVSDVSGVNGQNVNLQATLTDNGTALPGKPIQFAVNGTTIGTANTDANGIATLTYTITQNTGTYDITAIFSGDSEYLDCVGVGFLSVDPSAGLYLNITTSNANPTVGESFIITYKLGNYGPDTAENVTINFQIPEGMEFVGITIDSGTWNYKTSTRTVTWTLDNVPVGDPYLYLTVKAIKSGTYSITPSITSDTYNWNTYVPTLTISIKEATHSDDPENEAKAATKTVPMQKTGTNIYHLLLATLLTISGLITTKRK